MTLRDFGGFNLGISRSALAQALAAAQADQDRRAEHLRIVIEQHEASRVRSMERQLAALRHLGTQLPGLGLDFAALAALEDEERASRRRAMSEIERQLGASGVTSVLREIDHAREHALGIAGMVLRQHNQH